MIEIIHLSLLLQVEVFSYNWSVDPHTMEECVQEWNTKVGSMQ